MPGEESRTALDAGEILDGRYRVERQLGRGGMGTVYAVVDASTGNELALKQLGGRHVDQAQASARLRFRREFHTLASLKHPRIVHAVDYGESKHGPYYTMELLDGCDLRDLGVVDVPRAGRILRDVAAALAFLHARQLIHRDVAPRNIRRTSDGRAKLIDFGVLATAGAGGEVAGTPSYIAPENVRGLPLDGRADLYSLGVLGYWLVTGKHPYPVANIDELERAWGRVPTAPSAFVADVPAAYDELIMSLLCVDSLGRPRSAVEVLDRLGTFAGASEDGDLEVPRGYLASAAMVGRRQEMANVGTWLDQATREGGRSVLVEAESGTGKSRLLREIRLEAQVQGFAVVSADSESAGRGPYGSLRQIVGGLLQVMPGRALDLLGENAGLIGSVVPEVAARLEDSQAVALAGDPAEQRLMIQSQLARWLTDVAADRPLAFLIDDVQRCDEASAAVLVALARRTTGSPLMLIAALRTGEEIRAPLAIASFRGAAFGLPLAGLDAEEIEELVRSSFGDAQHVRRLAQWMRETTDGSPLHCTELIRRLVDDEVIRYVDGMWLIPDDIGSREAPRELGAAMEVRIGALSEDARAVGETLSVHGGALSLDLCIGLADRDEAVVFGALDELVTQGVLVGDSHGHRFRHDGLREALLRGIDEQRRRALHLRVGEFLSRAGDIDADREAEVGWHLFRGGELGRGGPLLERAGRRLFEVQALNDCIAPLEAAVEYHERQGSPRALSLELSFMLLSAGFTSDRAVGFRHAEPTVAAYREHSGVELADRLSRLLGRHLAFFVSLAWVSLLWRLRRQDVRGPRPIEALTTFSMAVGYACGLANASGDVDTLRRLVGQVEPLAIFKNRLPYAAYLGINAFPDLATGRFASARTKIARALEIMETDRLSPAPERELRFGRAGLHGIRSFLEVSDQTPLLADDLAAMEAVNLRYYHLAVKTTLITHHRLRGEERQALALEEEIETEVVQLGSWSIDVQVMMFAAPGYALCQDILGLKRCVEWFGRKVEEGYCLAQRLILCRAELHRARGEHDAARGELEGLVDEIDPYNFTLQGYVLAGLADTYLGLEEFELARDTAVRALELATAPDSAQVIPRLRAHRCLGLAQAALGEVEAAVEILEGAVEEADGTRCPSLAGLMHEARARVALMSNDAETYLDHARRVERWFRPTANPVLIGVAERLLDAAVARTDGKGVISDTPTVTVAANTTIDSVPSASGEGSHPHGESSESVRPAPLPAHRPPPANAEEPAP